MAEAATVSILLQVKDQASAQLQKVEGSMGRLASGFQKHRRTIGIASIAIGGAITGIGVMMAKSAATFDASMREVNSLIGLSEKEFQSLTKDTLAMSAAIGVDAVKSSEALYQAISAGVPKENVIEFMTVASKAAIAGVTDTVVAVDALSTVINAFKMPISEAQRVADILFVAVKGGKTTFEELGAAMSYVAPIAAALNVPFEQIGAAAATMTKQGIPTKQAFTALRQTFVSLMKPTAEMENALQQVGFASGRALLDAHGLQGGLQLLTTGTSLTESEMTKAFGSVEAFGAVLALTGINAEEAAADLRKSYEATGSATEAFDIINESASRQMEILKANLGVVSIELGTHLLPIVIAVMEKITALAQAVSAWAAEHPELTKVLMIAGVALGVLMLGLGSMLIILPQIVVAVGLLRIAMVKLTVSSGPFALVAIAIAGLAVVLLPKLLQSLNNVSGGIDTFTGSMNNATRAIQGLDAAQALTKMDALSTQLSDVNTQLAELERLTIGRALKRIVVGDPGEIAELEEQSKAIRQQINQLSEHRKGLRESEEQFQQLQESFQGVGAAALEMGENVSTATATVGPSLEELRRKVDDARVWFSNLTKANERRTESWEEQAERLNVSTETSTERLAYAYKMLSFNIRKETREQLGVLSELGESLIGQADRNEERVARMVEDSRVLTQEWIDDNEAMAAATDALNVTFASQTDDLLFNFSAQGQAWSDLGGSNERVIESMAKVLDIEASAIVEKLIEMQHEGESLREVLMRWADDGGRSLVALGEDFNDLGDAANAAGKAIAGVAAPSFSAAESGFRKRIDELQAQIETETNPSRRDSLIRQVESLRLQIAQNQDRAISQNVLFGAGGTAEMEVFRAGLSAIGAVVPGLAHGGIVNRPTLAMLGESGPEAVVPLGRGGVGMTVNLTINGDINGMDDFEAKVTSVIRDAVLGGGFSGVLARA